MTDAEEIESSQIESVGDMLTVAAPEATQEATLSSGPAADQSDLVGGAGKAPEAALSAAPWPKRRVLLLVALPGLAAIAAFAWFVAVPAIEGDLATQTRVDLQTAGIPTNGLNIDFSYRDGRITGETPAGFTVQEVADALDVPGAREIRIRLDPAPEPASDPATDPLISGTEVPLISAALGELEVRAIIGANGVLLTGAVQSDAQRDLLTTAVRERFGPSVVSDELLAPLPETTDQIGSPEADAAVAALADLISQLPDEVEGAAAISNAGNKPVLEFSGTTSSDERAATISSAVASAGAALSSTTVEVSVPPPPPPTAEELAAQLQPSLDSLNVAFSEIDRFKIDSFELSDDFTAALGAVPALLEAQPEPILEVVGHTDSRGREEANLELSTQRAQAVRDYLVSIGVDPARITLRGAGESEPIADNETVKGRVANRRVELRAIPRPAS